ncbi:MAG: TraB/GumN family protein, partial [Myxococcota bacterium]|nr:TraB/GumN family protein [Myxococcota bacterium]
MCKNRLGHILPRFVRFAPLVLPLLLGCAGASPPQAAELSSATVEKAEGKLILYEALSQNGARVYVLGSIHMADKSLYPMDPTIEQAYTSSDALVVEADVTKVDPLEVMKLVVRFASLPQGSALKQTISSDAYGQLEKFLAERGVPMSNVDGFEPWWVAMNVGILRFKEQGLSSDDGIDKHFLDRSHAA